MLTPFESTRRGLLRSMMGDWLERLVAGTPYLQPATEPGIACLTVSCRICADACPCPTVPSSFELTYVEG